jgi:hypothetical protein
LIFHGWPGDKLNAVRDFTRETEDLSDQNIEVKGLVNKIRTDPFAQSRETDLLFDLE